MGDVTSSEELGVLTRQMADAYADRASGYAEQVSNLIARRVEAFAPLGDDAADARRFNGELAEVFDDLDLGELETLIGEAMFQAGAAGFSATPLLRTEN